MFEKILRWTPLVLMIIATVALFMSLATLTEWSLVIGTIGGFWGAWKVRTAIKAKNAQVD
jgi:hypothetical protein